MKYLLFLSLMTILMSCDSPKKATITFKVIDNEIDSIFISESINDHLITSATTNGDEAKIPVDIDSINIGEINTKDGKNSYLTILRPNKNINIRINSDSTISTDNVADSLLNYLGRSNNEFIAEHQQYIFTTQDLDSVISLFDKLKTDRKTIIENQSKFLTTEETELLLFQNEARIHSFLFFLGRISKNLSPDNRYFQFTENIDNNTKWGKSLPQNLLYKHEINYLIDNDSLTNINTFLSYVEDQTSNKDLLSYLKAIYLKELIEHPSYWERHQKLFTTEIIEATIEQEKKNPYYDLIKTPIDNYFSSNKGLQAYDFTAESIDGKTIKLSDLEGKIVFIDSWASWCGSCIQHRPRVLKLAEQYKHDPRVKILMISVDKYKEDWIKFLTKKNQPDSQDDLIIVNGMRTKYGDRFNIKSIPKYMLIDQFGVIIDSDIPEPSKAVEEMIENELKRM